VATVLIFFIAGLLYLLRFERVDNLGAYRIPPETGILIPPDTNSCPGAVARKSRSHSGMLPSSSLHSPDANFALNSSAVSVNFSSSLFTSAFG